MRGKVLGGSSSINAMIYIRGNRHDFDHWQALGNPGWSYQDVLPYFKKSENQQHGASEFHGVDGLLNVTDALEPHLISQRFIDAADAIIRMNYLESEADLQVLVEAMKISRNLANSGAFDEYLGEEVAPSANVTSDEDIKAYIRQNSDSLYHPVGTCKMGTDAMAVVDSELRVRGVEGLRVVDASIMPTLTSGNTNAPTIMIGEKAADLIKGASQGSQQECLRISDRITV